MRSALYEWAFTMHLMWEFRCIIDVLLEGIMGLMVAGDFATSMADIQSPTAEIRRGKKERRKKKKQHENIMVCPII